ncbi:MAG: COG3014 family protein [Burkholderiales bacterium]
MKIKPYLLLLTVTSLAGCANNPLSSYKTTMDQPINQLEYGNVKRAESAIEVNNNMLYYLEHGTLLRMDMSYQASNQNFTHAQQYIEAWIASYHNGKLGQATDTLESSLINDKVIDYSAKDYEKVMLPTYKALNYFALGDLASSRVEITRMYNIEDVIQNYREMQYAKAAAAKTKDSQATQGFASLDQVEKVNKARYNFNAINEPSVLALKNSYQNAFSHYLAGFIFEALGEKDLARPGYVKAAQLNPGNQLIQQSINNIDQNKLGDTHTTDLLLVEEVGHAPQLKSVSLPVPFATTSGQNSCIHAVTIAFPELVPDQTTGTIRVRVDGKPQTPFLFTNFNLMAARYLRDELPNLFIRNLLRASKDLLLQQAACNNGGSIAGLLATVSGVILGQADDRTWVTLPSKIYATRLKLARGEHVVTVATATGTKQITIKLSEPYQIIAYRMIGNQVYFSPQNIMLTK